MKLLLAEDERELSNAIVRVLKHNNYTVDAVYDGAEALEYLTFGNYDGVILDIMMPKADGLSGFDAYGVRFRRATLLRHNCLAVRVGRSRKRP